MRWSEYMRWTTVISVLSTVIFIKKYFEEYCNHWKTFEVLQKSKISVNCTELRFSLKWLKSSLAVDNFWNKPAFSNYHFKLLEIVIRQLSQPNPTKEISGSVNKKQIALKPKLIIPKNNCAWKLKPINILDNFIVIILWFFKISTLFPTLNFLRWGEYLRWTTVISVFSTVIFIKKYFEENCNQWKTFEVFQQNKIFVNCTKLRFSLKWLKSSLVVDTF